MDLPTTPYDMDADFRQATQVVVGIVVFTLGLIAIGYAIALYLSAAQMGSR
jgi:uncharacterized membrane protein YczE